MKDTPPMRYAQYEARKRELLLKFQEHIHSERLNNAREIDYWRNQWRLLAHEFKDLVERY
jgi:hypothetical protein